MFTKIENKKSVIWQCLTKISQNKHEILADKFVFKRRTRRKSKLARANLVVVVFIGC